MLQVENVDNYVTDCEFTEINTNKPPQRELLPIQIKEVEKVVPNNIGHVKNTFDEVCSKFTIALESSITVKSKDIPNIIPTDKADKIKHVDVDDNFVATQDINNDLREKSNVTLANAKDELLVYSVGGNVKNEQDIMAKQIIPAIYEKKVNVDNDVTDFKFGEINTNKPPQGELIQDEIEKQVINLDDYKKERQLDEDMVEDNVASEDLPIQLKKIESVVLNNTEHGKNTFDDVGSQFTIALPSPIEDKSEDIPNIVPTDKANKMNPINVGDNYFVGTQDINKDQREKSNVSLVVVSNADDELLPCSVDGNVKHEQDITPKQIIPALYENKVNVDNDVTDCKFGETNKNKPQGELIQDEMTKQIIDFDDYKTDKQPVEDMPADNVVSEDLPIQINKIDRVVPNNTEHVKNTLDEVVSHLAIALPTPIEVKSEDIPNIIPNTRKDINKGQRGESKVSLVVKYNADDEVVLGSVYGKVKNEQDENKNKYCGIHLPSQENKGDISANYAMLTNFSDSSDEESTPKKSKRFTFTDSDFPDSDEISDIVKMYPRPVLESFSESESEHSSDDEIDEILRRFRNKTVSAIKIDLSRLMGVENLPDRVMTRLRNSAPMFKPRYVNEQEDQMDEDIILENIKRLKAFKKAKDSKKHKSIKKETTPRRKTGNKSNERRRKVTVNIETPARKGKKSKMKSFTRNNTIKDSLQLNSISAAKTITRRTRSMKKESDVKNTQNKCIFPGNKNKTPHQPDHKRKLYNKERICPEIEGRRSKRQQKAKEKKDTMKAPISLLKKSKPKQSTVYNVPSSSFESPKSLKRSLVDDSDVPSPKRTRSHNSNNNKSIDKASLLATPARAVRTRHVHLSAFPDKRIPYVHLERYEPAEIRIRTLNSNRSFLTRSQLARRRYHRACKRTMEAEERRKKGARTSTKPV